MIMMIINVNQLISFGVFECTLGIVSVHDNISFISFDMVIMITIIVR